MTVNLIIDNREQYIKKFLTENYPDRKVEYCNLLHGDIVIQIDGKVVCLFERKTIEDLTASIVDTRYQNQKVELLNNYDRSSIYYIVEGHVDYKKNADQVIGAVINTMLRDDVKVFNTKSLEETVAFILNVFNRITENPGKYLHPGCNKSLVMKKEKGGNKFTNMLCQIPGVSQKIADRIVCKWKNFHEFYESLRELSSEEKTKELNSVCSNGSRAVSKTTIASIIHEVFE